MAESGKVPAFSELDIYVLVDTSGSMRHNDEGPQKNLRRLDAVKESAIALGGELQDAVTGKKVTIIRFAGLVDPPKQGGADQIETIFDEFRPMGNTNTKDALALAIQSGLSKRAAAADPDKKSVLIICFTDGAPSDELGTAQVIVNATQQIKDRSELGILFVSVGNDGEAAGYLAKLNNDLPNAGAAHDIVAVVTLADLETKSLQDLVTLAYTA